MKATATTTTTASTASNSAAFVINLWLLAAAVTWVAAAEPREARAGWTRGPESPTQAREGTRGDSASGSAPGGVSLVQALSATKADEGARGAGRPPASRRVPPNLRLQVSPDHRHLVDGNGQPFFFLGDTAWDLFLRLDRKETDEYLEKRAAQGFNVIVTILIGWKPGVDERNAYHEAPLIDKDPARPNEKYFAHVDYVVRKANSLGLFVAIAPAWSDWMYKYVGSGPHPFTPQNARTFGRFVGRRYRNDAVIWMIGGDRDPTGYEDILRAMATGLDEGDGDADFLTTFHGEKMGKLMPPDNVYYERLCSSHLVGNEPWLDFHGAYSGHQWAYPTYRLVEQDRAMKPTRPVIDLEPCYENHPYHRDGAPYFESPEKWDQTTRGTAAMIRAQAWWALLAGAAGHTYGAHEVWGFYDKQLPFAALYAKYHLVTPWRQALDYPGGAQMGIMRRLFESRRWQTLEPDQGVIVAGQQPGERHLQAARAADGKFLFVYLPRGDKVTVDMTKINGQEAAAWWFNPRDGRADRIGRLPCRDTHDFSPPSQGVDNDWVLVLDDAAQDVRPPGRVGQRARGDRGAPPAGKTPAPQHAAHGNRDRDSK